MTARIEIAATPPATPPAMGPTFELCRPVGIGRAVLEAALLDESVLDVAIFEVELVETEELEGPIIVPGPSSGEPMKVRCGCHGETVTGEETREYSHHRRHTIC